MVRNKSRPPRRVRQARRLTAPVIATIDGTAVATADLAVNTGLYLPAHSSTTSFVDAMTFRLRSATFSVNQGTSAVAKIYFVIRKVPEGYSPPSVVVSTSITTFADPQNVLAYGIAPANLTDQFELTILKSTVNMTTGDSIYIQATSDTSSTGQSYSATVVYDVDA